MMNDNEMSTCIYTCMVDDYKDKCEFECEIIVDRHSYTQLVTISLGTLAHNW